MARILVAEDDDIAGEILVNALIDAGHAVGLIENGADALRAIRARKPDLVILDCDLPEMHGVTIVKQMRTDKELWAIPVMMLTASCGRVDEEIARMAGADAYLRKPFDPDYIAYRVDEALESLRRPYEPGKDTHTRRVI